MIARQHVLCWIWQISHIPSNHYSFCWPFTNVSLLFTVLVLYVFIHCLESGTSCDSPPWCDDGLLSYDFFCSTISTNTNTTSASTFLTLPAGRTFCQHKFAKCLKVDFPNCYLPWRYCIDRSCFFSLVNMCKNVNKSTVGQCFLGSIDLLGDGSYN